MRSGFTPNGNGDGKLDHFSYNGGRLNIWPENRAFWKNLSESGFQPDNVAYEDTYTTNHNIEVGVHTPKIPGFKNALLIPMYYASGLDPSNYDIETNLYLLFKRDTTFSGTGQGPLSPVESTALDKKLDDANPITGIMAIACEASSVLSNGGTGNPPYQLDMSVTDPSCTPHIRMGFTMERKNVLSNSFITSLGHTP